MAAFDPPGMAITRPGLYLPVLNQLSSGTTVIGAWSTCRRLLVGVTYGMLVATAGGVGGGSSGIQVGFDAKGRIDMRAVNQYWASFNNGGAATVGLGCTTGSGNLYDQSGNANHLSTDNGFNTLGSSLVLPHGSLNATVRIFDRSILCAAGLGYAGYGTGASQPVLSTAQLASGNMAVSFGAVPTWWGIVACRPKAVAQTNQLIAYQHSGDSSPTNATTSFALSAVVTTPGGVKLEGQANNQTLGAGGNAVSNAVHIMGFIANNTTWTNWIDGAPVGSSSYTQTLGSGGSLKLGANSNGDMIEAIVGTTTTPGDWAVLMANMAAFYQVV